MRILVTGSNGLLGTKLLERLLADPGHQPLGADHTDRSNSYLGEAPFWWRDVASSANVEPVIDAARPDAVIRAAAFTNVDACERERVPGRRSDVLDCQWLQQLHTFGLLAGAFGPDDQICVLRSSMRQRAMLATYVGQHVQHLQKALVQMNLRLQMVLDDITGATGLRIIRAVLAGERDPDRLTAMRHGRCKHAAATLAEALRGDWREEHLFALEQAVELVETYQAKIAACDARIQTHLRRFEDRGTGVPTTSAVRSSNTIYPRLFTRLCPFGRQNRKGRVP